MGTQQTYFVYIMASISRAIYTGLTNSLYHRVRQHKSGEKPTAFTVQYRMTRLVYYEQYDFIQKAIKREKQIKRWRREKKVKLIESVNPRWKDLSLEPGFDKRSNHG